VRRAQPVDPSQTPVQARRAQPPSPARPPGYQPERRVTRIEGGVNNRGASSVAAMATPLGRYKKALSDAIGSRWYFYVRSEIGLFSVGTAVIRFHVLPSGRVTAVQVLSNSSNESFASVTIRSIMEADIPPIPPDVSELLENNRIEVDFTFSILSN
jgi:TonB family protein